MIIGGKTSISIFGTEDDNQKAYQKTSDMYAPPPSHTYGAPSYQAPSAPSYQAPAAGSNENNNPYQTTSQSYAPYGGYSAPQSNVTTFGSGKAMRTEHNLGADGEERSSVKVHHPPGGGGSLNLFGGDPEPAYEKPKYSAPTYEPSSQQPAGYGSYQSSSAGYGQAPSYDQPPTYGGYEQPASYGGYEQPASYGGYEEQKQPSYAPSGFTSASSYSQPEPIAPSNLNVSSVPQTFGQRVESGNNSGPTTDKSSIRVHAPPGGKSSVFF